MGTELPERLVLYDGACGLCEWSVRWLLAHDREGEFRFAPLQGETAAEVRDRHPDESIPDSVVLVENRNGKERLFAESRAVFRICDSLPGAWRWLGRLAVLPRFLTDFGYRVVAGRRYRLWGRRDEPCRVPLEAERERFLP